MESRQPSPSVVARLMGLEEFSPQQPVQKKPRVLSDKYLQRVGSIGTREKHQPLGYLNSKESRDYQLLESDTQNGSSSRKRNAQLSPEVSFSDSNYRSCGNASAQKNAAKRIGFVESNMRTRDALGSRFLNSGNSSRKAELTTLSSLEQVELGMTRTTDQELIISGSRSLVSGTGFEKHGPCSGKSRQYGWKVRSIGCLRRPTPLHWDLDAIRNHTPSNNHGFAKHDGKVLELGIKKSSNNSEQSASIESDAGTEFVNESPLEIDEQSLDEEIRKFLVKDHDDSCHAMDSSIQKDICVGTYEKESISSYCSCTDPESTVSLEDVYQSSPISVLDASYRKENSSCSDSWEGDGASLHGCLQMRLELLKSEISDVYSEDFDTMVSSEGDAREESVGGDIEPDALKPFRGEESRDFSYLVDVLNDAGVLNGGSFPGLNSWHSEECTIGFSIFDTLEKKYGDQPNWKRTDRRLLFDRINSGLLEILQSSMTQHFGSNTVARRFILSHGQEDIEEEVWMLLASQEKGVEKDYEKVLGKDDKWLDLADHIQDIGTEIANSLFDELVEDSFSI